MFSEDSRRYFVQLIGPDRSDLIQASVWVDSQDAHTKYPNSEEWHCYTPYRKSQTFVFERDYGFNQSG